MSQTEFKLPRMGESITEGTIINWMVQPGDSFEEGDIIVEVGTDKVDNEVPAPFSGTLIETKYNAKDVVKIGEVIAILKASEGASKKDVKNNIEEEIKTAPTAKKASKVVPKQSGAVSSTYQVPVNRTNKFYSPLVAKIAREHHISYEELARIPATGKDGRIQKSDVFKYIEEGRPAQFAQPVAEAGYSIPQLNLDKGKGKIVEMDRMRQMIADHMVYSKHTSPHVTAYIEADLTNMVNWRNANKESFQKKHGEKMTFTPLFVEAVAKAVKDFPMINVSVDGTYIIVKENINIGMATALPSGNLIVPVVRDADKKDLLNLAKEINELAEKARTNKLKADDTKGSSFTISNVGTFGSLMGTPIINQPEAAILATGIIKKRAEVIEKPEGDTIEIRQMMYLSLSFDHRIVDGFLGGSFLRRIADYFEDFDINRKI
ncbi:dihydrolipoamide acetyltransferase family protein [Planktosalinus lacus]|uniref:Dihydrolipoamide acetyltransferase component of pyruvate dehydrogenase complex n=1 Tax=Planktosalinus lacus TaxID=1526573 RepID=A0A8J2Y5P0_9FLAO|nr:dihydrolipoamide acetyltransferase family protein [Planktosalinus lacus]GGD86760.1 dihydrolipoamide acetyltransferase component of pyruvate dehydrogenase complex [Planktosalinus lacus]